MRGQLVLEAVRTDTFISYLLFTSGKEPAWKGRKNMRNGFNPWVEKSPWRRKWQPTPVFLPGESHGQRSLAGYSPRGCKESNTTKVTAQAPTGAVGGTPKTTIVISSKIPLTITNIIIMKKLETL